MLMPSSSSLERVPLPSCSDAAVPDYDDDDNVATRADVVADADRLVPRVFVATADYLLADRRHTTVAAVGVAALGYVVVDVATAVATAVVATAVATAVAGGIDIVVVADAPDNDAEVVDNVAVAVVNIGVKNRFPDDIAAPDHYCVEDMVIAAQSRAVAEVEDVSGSAAEPAGRRLPAGQIAGQRGGVVVADAVVADVVVVAVVAVGGEVAAVGCGR